METPERFEEGNKECMQEREKRKQGKNRMPCEMEWSRPELSFLIMLWISTSLTPQTACAI